MGRPPDIKAQLRSRHRRVTTAQAKLEEAKAELLEAILQAVTEGYSLSEIGDCLGVSKGRAQQLVRQADGRGRSSR